MEQEIRSWFSWQYNQYLEWSKSTYFFLYVSLITGCHKAWAPPEVTGIGAGIDSFYEYALKWYVMSGAFIKWLA